MIKFLLVISLLMMLKVDISLKPVLAALGLGALIVGKFKLAVLLWALAFFLF